MVPVTVTGHGYGHFVRSYRHLAAAEFFAGIGLVRAGLERVGIDVVTVDASWFVPQSRPRLFIIGSLEPLGGVASGMAGPLRSESVAAFVRANQDLMLQEHSVPIPLRTDRRLSDVVERLDASDGRWWDGKRFGKFMGSLSPLHRDRLALLGQDGITQWRTAYRRTRNGIPVWEIRSDDISGCLRTARGGSSRQAVVEVSSDGVRARWMTPREYARLQGVPDEFDYSAVTNSQALFGFGDAVCVPVIEWLAEHALVPAAIATGGQVSDLTVGPTGPQPMVMSSGRVRWLENTVEAGEAPDRASAARMTAAAV